MMKKDVKIWIKFFSKGIKKYKFLILLEIFDTMK